jgi:LPXTG-site transpeptidase (sortase) family protein
MTWFVAIVARLIEAGERIKARKWSFLGVFAVVCVSSIAILANLGLLPDATKASAAPAVTLSAHVMSTASSTPVVVIEEPMKIEIPSINLSATIANPTTTNIEALDQQLLKGAVRYPTSAKLGETGNMVLFGHSSYLPIVGNQAYKTFDGIQKLVAGDVVTVYSSGTTYTYRVRNVAKESAASDAGIDLAVTDRVLTLATCNSFGAKTDRFVVTADFVESHAISS